MKKLLSCTGLLLLFACPFAHSQSFGGINLVDSEVTINGEASVFNACLPPPNFDDKTCLIPGVPLAAGFPVAALPNSAASMYCVLRAVVSEICSSTSSVVATGMEVGGDSDVFIAQWQVFVSNRHWSEIFCPYDANAETDADMYLELTVDGPPNTNRILYYDFSGFLGAISKPEAITEDSAKVTVSNLSFNGVDLLQAGNLPNSFSSSAVGIGGGYSDLALSGWMSVPTNTPILLEVSADAFAFINPPGQGEGDPFCGMQWREKGAATFFGNLTLSLSPIPGTVPSSGTSPAFSYFSVDIGSAGELSDPAPTGAEFFDPGDAYRIQGPIMPQGGANGPLNDASFMGFDIPPTPPDPSVPSLTAAPVGSGLPPSSVIHQYLNIDGLARTDFVFTAPVAGEIPILTNPLQSQCVFAPRHLYLSFDDDQPGHYTDVNPSVPANSTPDFTGKIFGSNADKDEIVEMYTMPFLFGGSTVISPLASESMIHPNLAPNPQPIGPHPQNDDLNALSLGYSGDCDTWYVSVDHEATGVLPDGTQPDPGIIYRVAPGSPSGLIPVAGPAELGIPPGTDIDAFEFVAIYQPTVQPQGPALAVLFSVDVDDPLTPIDESGGMNPGMLYASYMNGAHFVYDSASFNYNVDAISNLPNSIANPANTNTCNSYNFTSPPTNLDVTISGTTLIATWDVYPFATQCQLAGNNANAPGDQTFIVNNASPPGPNSWSITSGQIQPNTTYRLRVRCGCNLSNVSPFSAYVFVTTPPSIPDPNGPDIFEEAAMEAQRIEMFPNPAKDRIQLIRQEAFDGMVQVSVFNSLGQEVHAESFDGSALSEGRSISISHLEQGAYVVQIRAGDHIESLPLVITR